MSVDVDLHLHSTASDGRLTPRELVAHAVAAGVRMLALTDHDSVDGLGPAEHACHALGATFVTGVELSAGWRGRSIHVVGLGIDPAAAALTTIIASLADVRMARAERIAAKLDKARAPGTAALAHALAQNPRPTRTHFARALVELGAVPDLEAAFKRYLGHGAPAHVTTDWPALADAVAAIVAAGGLAVLAHPLRYPLSAGARRELGHEFREAGGVALEVATAGTTAEQLEQATALAVRTGLDGSCGSDFHDPANPWIQPGRLAKLPLSVRPVWRRLGLPARVPQQA